MSKMTRVIPKSKRPRYRYILFRVGIEPERQIHDREVTYVIMRHLSSHLNPNVRMIRFKGGYGVIRVERRDAIAARCVLESQIDAPSGRISITPIRTSGTLRALRRKSPDAMRILEDHLPGKG